VFQTDLKLQQIFLLPSVSHILSVDIFLSYWMWQIAKWHSLFFSSQNTNLVSLQNFMKQWAVVFEENFHGILLLRLSPFSCLCPLKVIFLPVVLVVSKILQSHSVSALPWLNTVDISGQYLIGCFQLYHLNFLNVQNLVLRAEFIVQNCHIVISLM